MFFISYSMPAFGNLPNFTAWMTSIYKIFFIAIASLLFSHSVFAQGEVGDTTLTANADSLNKVVLTEYNTRLAEIEQQAKEDSISKAKLQEELASLKTT